MVEIPIEYASQHFLGLVVATPGAVRVAYEWGWLLSVPWLDLSSLVFE